MLYISVKEPCLPLKEPYTHLTVGRAIIFRPTTAYIEVAWHIRMCYMSHSLDTFICVWHGSYVTRECAIFWNRLMYSIMLNTPDRNFNCVAPDIFNCAGMSCVTYSIVLTCVPYMFLRVSHVQCITIITSHLTHHTEHMTHITLTSHSPHHTQVAWHLRVSTCITCATWHIHLCCTWHIHLCCAWYIQLCCAWPTQ